MNVCIRCGKDRVVAKTWKEKVETAVGITVWVHTDMVCPDGVCQKLVEKELAMRKEKKEAIRVASEERAQLRKKKMAVRA